MKLAKAYEPKRYEEQIYALWETSGAFSPTPSKTGIYYSVVMPPPNANGNLHLGHALTVGLEDIVVRYHRMKGDGTVYIPGADHAGFETWVVYEKQLEKYGKSRFDFSREELYAQVWEFVEEHRGNMEIQLRRLGASCDWQHLVFSLDPAVIATAYDTFQKLWKDDLVYRGKRIVNFCTKHRTSFADIEVEHTTEKGKLWQIGYQLTDGSGEIVVATTRPETMLGDTAVAVHPDDERYRVMVGKTVVLPLTDREVPIIADTAIDKDFGTGAVKITPSHDPLDFEIAQRHDLPFIDVIGHDGKLTAAVPAQFRGLTVQNGRSRVLAALTAADVLRGEEDYEHAVGTCYKCGTVIEPMVKDQWFFRMQPLAARAIAAIEEGRVRFTPAAKGRELVAYLRELRDWNISRQIPWGIPIPAFQNVADEGDWIFDTRVDQPTITVDGVTYRREEDTFDTWFSSGQWPYVVTQYAHGGELSDFYPTHLMETGVDLLRQWVGRMIMLGLYRTGKAPFAEVYMHGMVLDEKGQKMSKSKGNVISPQGIIDEHGSDALRMGIVVARSPGLQQAFSQSKVIAGRNFCNKLWNIARYVEGKTGEEYRPKKTAPKPRTIADHWIVQRLSAASRTLAELIENHRFAEAAEYLYHTVWDDMADWYVESSKQQDTLDILTWALETCLKLSHPFVPFVSETIWQTLQWREGELLIQTSWPKPVRFDAAQAASFEQLQALVSESRYVSRELGRSVRLVYDKDRLIADNRSLIKGLAQLEGVVQRAQARGLRLAVAGTEAWLDVDEQTVYEHQSKLESRLAEVRLRLERLERRLDNPKYCEQAPARVVDETRREADEQRQLEERLQRELTVLS